MSAHSPPCRRLGRNSRAILGTGFGCAAIVALLIASPLASATGNERSFVIHVGEGIDILGERSPDWPVREPYIAVDPRNPAILVAGAIDTSLAATGVGHVWDRYFRSADGGRSWSSFMIPGFPGDTSKQGRSSPLFGQNASADPMVAFDDQGNLYYSGLATSFPPGTTFANWCGNGGSLSDVVFVAKFAEDGARYVRTALASNPATACADFPRLAVDASGGAHDGSVYVMFDNLSSGNAVGSFVRSTDGGRTFSSPTQFNGIFLWPAVDPRGNLYAVGWNASASGIVSFPVWKSVDGGQTFLAPVSAGTSLIGFAPLPSFAPNYFGGSNFEIAADCHGVYVVYPGFDESRGVWTLNFTRSTDGGQTWSASERLGEAPNANQYEAALAVAGGIVSVAWYDSRNGQLPNGNVSRLDVYYVASFDNGRTFSNDVRVSARSWNPSTVYFDDSVYSILPLQSAWFGEYFGLAASPDSAHVLWVSNQDACEVTNATYGCVDQDVMTATITFGDD